MFTKTKTTSSSSHSTATSSALSTATSSALSATAASTTTSISAASTAAPIYSYEQLCKEIFKLSTTKERQAFLSTLTPRKDTAYENLIKAACFVQDLTKKHFYNGSINREEDSGDIKKRDKALLEIKKLKKAIRTSSTKDKDFAFEYKLFNAYSGGNCQAQATWAFGQYIQMNLHPVTLVKFNEKQEDVHIMIMLGDHLKDPVNTLFHDPHSGEIFPFWEYFLSGHNVNRYNKNQKTMECKMNALYKKDTSWDSRTICKFLGIEKISELNYSEQNRTKEIDAICLLKKLRTEEHWLNEQIKHNNAGAKFFKEKNWKDSITAFMQALTIANNLSTIRDNNEELTTIYRNLYRAYTMNEQLAEASHFSYCALEIIVLLGSQVVNRQKLHPTNQPLGKKEEDLLERIEKITAEKKAIEQKLLQQNQKPSL